MPSNVPPRYPKGLSFDIADLILVRNRSEAICLRPVPDKDQIGNVEG